MEVRSPGRTTAKQLCTLLKGDFREGRQQHYRCLRRHRLHLRRIVKHAVCPVAHDDNQVISFPESLQGFTGGLCADDRGRIA